MSKFWFYFACQSVYSIVVDDQSQLVCIEIVLWVLQLLSPPHIILTCLFDTFRSEQLYKEPGLEIKSFSRWKCVPRDFRVENVTTVSLCFLLLLQKKSHTQNNLYIFFATIISCFFFVAATLLVYNRSWFVLTKMYSGHFGDLSKCKTNAKVAANA